MLFVYGLLDFSQTRQFADLPIHAHVDDSRSSRTSRTILRQTVWSHR